MGVKGLQTFLEQCCPEACYGVNLADMAQEYYQKYGKKPTIAVDTMGCIRPLYGRLNWILGGQLQEFIMEVKHFLSSFEKAGIHLVFFCDGLLPTEKKPEWIRRRQTEVIEVRTIFDILYRRCSQSQLEHLYKLPPSLGSLFRIILKDVLGCEVHNTIEECDKVLSQFAKENKCLGILGQDTDYVIFDTGCHYFSIRNLNLDTLSTCIYDQKALAHLLQLQVSQLPLLATLLGNDIIDVNTLMQFHQNICHMKRRPPIRILIRKLATYISREARSGDLNSALARITWDIFGKDCVDLMQASLTSYRLDPVEQDPTVMSAYSTLVIEARKRHCGLQDMVDPYGILSGAPFCLGVTMEDFGSELPDSVELYRPIRARMWGAVLADEACRDLPTSIKEICPHKGNLTLEQLDEVDITPYEGSTPGLMQLWNDKSEGMQEARWKLFCHAISERLKPESLKAIPPELVIPTALLFYLHQDCEKFMLEWEMEALLCVAAFCHFAPETTWQYYSMLQVPKLPNPRIVHISSIFMRGVFNLLNLLGTCGHPITLEQGGPWHYFNGKFFHHLYEKAKCGLREEELHGNGEAVQETCEKMRLIIFGE